MFYTSLYKKQKILSVIEHQELKNNISDELFASRMTACEVIKTVIELSEGMEELVS